ncbi:fimbrial biogenesis outer membrane usher protein [Klebsiella aerogenes]|nr:fimbrial biogenesis outer membrane usher protein [Klebsiella aerogenes]
MLLSWPLLGAQARDYFNPAFLKTGPAQQANADLSVFEENGAQSPGTYRVDIYLNKDKFDTRDVVFKFIKGNDGKETLQPCISVATLAEMGVKTASFPALGSTEAECANLAAIPQSSATFRFNVQQLLLSMPQAAVSQNARGYVPESQWDEGITALLLNYSLSGANNYTRTNDSQDSDSQYVNLRPGINIGPWRLRNYTTWNRDSNGQDKWDTVYTYVQRDIIRLKSQLTLGESSSPADIFDSVPFRGGQLASDDDMLPDSLKGYAPVVRGIARSNAQVTVRQNGYTIYQTYVTPGAFEITDMYPTGSSGDLNVTIKEADGSEQQLVVPFASLPVLQREGRLKYSITGGQYRAYDNSVDKTGFGQATGIYGLPFGVTLYGGGQFAGHYQSLAFGAGKNMETLGAISTDVTQSWSTQKDRQKQQGQSWRIRYSKDLLDTGTNITIAGYRYSTSGYYTLSEVLDTYNNDSDSTVTDRRRNRAEMTLSQTLWDDAGSLSLNLVSEDYWNSQQSMRSIGVGYSNSWQYFSYNLNYSYNRNTQDSGNGGKRYDNDQQFSLNISIPLDSWMSSTYADYSMNTSQQGNTTNNVGLSGSALADNNLSWSVSEGYGSQGEGNSGNMSADYRGTYAEVNAAYAYDRDMQRVNYGLQGGIVAHANGITLGQSLNDTIALVAAQGAGGVGVTNQTGVSTDFRGYAIVPYVSPYRKTQISLNTEMLPDDVDIETASQNVVPTRGAVVRASFNASVGQRVMMTLVRQDGGSIPFGAMVSDPTQKTQAFIVGDGGQVYLTGLAESGKLTVKWGSDAGQQCQVDYQLKQTEASGLQMLQAMCR